MTQALFRIGGVYRDKAGDIITLKSPPQDDIPKWSEDEAWAFKGDYAYGARSLTSGVCPECHEAEEYHLIPGELHNFNGEWLPVEEPMAPYFAEALEEKTDNFVWLLGPDEDEENAAMLARDAANYVARPAAPVVIQEPAKTSHSPIAGLTFLENRDHRFGSFRF